MEYQFDKRVQSGKFDVRIDSAAGYGYFEHEELGDECGGGLWFQAGALTDYDGVAVLPAKVIAGIRGLGFVVDADFE